MEFYQALNQLLWITGETPDVHGLLNGAVDEALRVPAEGKSLTIFGGESRPQEGGLGQELKSLRTHRGRARAR